MSRARRARTCCKATLDMAGFAAGHNAEPCSAGKSARPPACPSMLDNAGRARLSADPLVGTMLVGKLIYHSTHRLRLLASKLPGRMGSAYTPGLTVSGDIAVRRIRRLPIKGEVLVKQGTQVEHDTVLARALLPGPLQTLKLAEKLGIEAKEVRTLFRLKEGDAIEKGQMVAETKGIFGRFKQKIESEFTGTVESISEVTGNALIREASIPVDVNAYIKGVVAEVLPDEGAIVETRCAMVQGIFGVGGERNGVIRIAVKTADDVLDAAQIQDTDAGKILVGGSGITYDAIQRATQVGVIGLVAGGVKDGDLTKFLGYDIGVAITGQEAIDLTIMVTEG